MKNLFVLFFTVLVICSCGKKLESLNEDIKHVNKAEAVTFFSNSEKNLSDILSTIERNRNIWRLFSQYLTENTYLERTDYFIDVDNIPGRIWDIFYIDVINNLKRAQETIAELPPAATNEEMLVRVNQASIIEIFTVYSFSMLVEIYGDVPYTESLDFMNVQPKYDDAKTIYLDLIKRLDLAINEINEGSGSFGSGDLIYNGNVSKWKKFANSLKLRMGLRIFDADQPVGEKAVKESFPNVFTSNSDNAIFQYLNSVPNTNPMWVPLVQSKLKYFVATKNFVDLLNSLNDPRREIFLSTVDGKYVGAVYGVPVPYDIYSHLGEKFYEPTLPGILLDYSSVEFLLAEAVERGIINSFDAEYHYDKAIRASFEYYGVSGADEYLSQESVAYSTASGDWKRKIGIQKWIALNNQGLEAWTEYRRLDQPNLQVGPNSSTDRVPTRFTYPLSEQTRNAGSYKEASANIGGDALTTKLFWDVY